MEMLQRRATASSGQVALEVRLWEPTSVRAIDLGESAIDEWVEEERGRLVTSLPGPGSDKVGGLIATLNFEKRSREEYLGQVERYLEATKEALGGEIAARAVGRGLGRVRFAVANRTERNFAEVAVEIRIDGRIGAFFDAEEAMDASPFPKRPRPWGDTSHLSGGLVAPALSRRVPRLRPGQIDNSASTCVQFDPFHVRPLMIHSLPAVSLVLFGPPFPTELTARWHATSTSADGFDAGEMSIPVDPTPLAIDEVLSPSDEDAGE
jgi:hypothetical protein